MVKFEFKVTVYWPMGKSTQLRLLKAKIYSYCNPI